MVRIVNFDSDTSMKTIVAENSFNVLMIPR